MTKKMDWFYSSREERSRWVTERFAEQFKTAKNVLDVGCGVDKNLKKIISPSLEYVGMDHVGSPEIDFDFDKVDVLPFKDKEFDLVVCTDVLEHLETIHAIYKEIMRVSAESVIITLPIAARLSIVKKILSRKPLARYGLPVDRPEDRHRWFYTYDEVEKFIKENAEKNNFIVKSFEADVEYPIKNTSFLKKIMSLVSKKITATAVIILLERKK
jgi:ubiquinone/menaquinone biosynthesis C-methylase UbiE